MTKSSMWAKKYQSLMYKIGDTRSNIVYVKTLPNTIHKKKTWGC